MTDLRRTPFLFNSATKPVTDPQLVYSVFSEELAKLEGPELVPFIRCYVQERTPAAFAQSPLLWEAIRIWISKRIGVDAREIGLSGSAQAGFSLRPDTRGAPFNRNKSDLDLFIVNQELFHSIEREARQFTANSTMQKSYPDQVRTVESTLNKRYIDLIQIPAIHERYPTIANGLNEASIVVDRLKCHGFELRPSHFRIYEGWASLAAWVERSYSEYWKENKTRKQ